MKIHWFNRLKKSSQRSSEKSARQRQRPRWRSQLSVEGLERRAMLADSHGGYSPFDVDHDGVVAPLDALIIINELNRSVQTRSGGIPTASQNMTGDGEGLPHNIDVDGDGIITPLDALIVINELNDPTDELVQIRLATTDLSGAPITQIAQGGTFQLRGYVRDLRISGTGVAAVYSDVTYDAALASAVGSVIHVAPFTSVPFGSTATPGLIDEVGGSNFFDMFGTTERHYFTIEMQANAGGMLLFETDPVEGGAIVNTLLFGLSAAIPFGDIFYGSTSIEILGLPTVSIADSSLVEGDAGTSAMQFTVTLAEASTETVMVNYATVAGTATEGVDYQAAAGQLTFLPGETSKVVMVNVIGDTLSELDETFSVVLSNPVNIAIGDGTAVGAIQDNDPLPMLAINDVLQAEGNAGTTEMQFTVTLSQASGRQVTVDYATAAGTAAAGVDYQTKSGTVTFAPGETSKTISINLLGDTTSEANETFTVLLSNPAGAMVNDGTGQGTILNDDDAPTISVNNATVIEPSGPGTAAMTFVVSLSAASGQTVTVDFATADDTAMAGSDYTAASGTVTFAPGETFKNVVVNVNFDVAVESDEMLFLNLSNPTNATILDGQGVGTIVDAAEDKLVRLRLETTDLAGNPITQIGQGNQFQLRGYVQDLRTDPMGVAAIYADVTFDAALASIISSITHPAPFTDVPGGTTSPGLIDEVGGSAFLVQTGGADTLFFRVNLMANAGGILNFLSDPADDGAIHNTLLHGLQTAIPFVDIVYGMASFEIIGLPEASVSDATLVEGDAGATAMQFTVSLSRAGDQTITVDYATVAGSAEANIDYESTFGQVTFLPGETSKIVTVNILGDTLSELDETFNLVLSNPVNGLLGDAVGVGTIEDDDPLPDMVISDAALFEGNAGSTVFEFTVSLSDISGRNVTVDYTTIGGTATVGADYQTKTGTVTFAPGEMSKVISINVIGDALNEADETFFVQLSNASGANLALAEGIGQIINDDPLPAIAINNVTAVEPAAPGTVPLSFIVSLSAPSGQQVSVNYATANGSAIAGSDYAAAAGTVVFAPGETSKMVTVDINFDLMPESDETLFVNLSGAVNATIADAQGVGTIVDFVDDKLVRIRLETTDLAGNPILTVDGGELFRLNGYVRDLRDMGPGVFQAYLDVLFDQALVMAVGPITYGPEYANVRTGSLATPGLIDEVGAAASLSELDATDRLLFSVIVQGVGGGIANFSPDPADLQPDHQVLIYDDFVFPVGAIPVELSEIQFIGTSIEITPPPLLLIGDAVLGVEGDSGTTPLVFTVTLVDGPATTVTVDFATLDGTALAGLDYELASGTLTFLPGETSKTITVNILGDTTDEFAETFFVQLSNAVNGFIPFGNDSGEGTIVDDDEAPTLSIAGGTGVEVVSDVVFTVTLSQVSGKDVFVDYATSPITAAAGVDYVPTSGTLMIPAGSLTAAFSVETLFDTVVDAGETLLATLSNPFNATIANGSAIGTINDIILSSLSGHVYADANKNGFREASELGYSGVLVRLTGTDIAGNLVDRLAATDGFGKYVFAGLLPGDYQITELHPDALIDGAERVGSLGGSIAANDQFFLSLGADEHGVNYDFGEIGLKPGFLTSGGFYARPIPGAP